MSERQPDLFSYAQALASAAVPSGTSRPVASALDDEALIRAIPAAGITDAAALAEEAGRRRLTGAVPALETLCGRLRGFGRDGIVPEQVAACGALAAIGGQAAAEALGRLFAQGAFEGPTLVPALAAAQRLNARLRPAIVSALLRHADPEIRAAACQNAVRSPDVIKRLIELLDDLHASVATAAACALGRFGRNEALAPLKRLLTQAPSIDIIDAAAPLAERDHDLIVMLERVAHGRPDLEGSVIDALDAIDCPAAAQAAARLHGEQAGNGQ